MSEHAGTGWDLVAQTGSPQSSHIYCPGTTAGTPDQAEALGVGWVKSGQ